MATIEELIRQYDTDEALRKEIADILADGKVTMTEFLTFAKAHDVDISIGDLPKYIEEAKKMGFLK